MKGLSHNAMQDPDARMDFSDQFNVEELADVVCTVSQDGNDENCDGNKRPTKRTRSSSTAPCDSSVSFFLHGLLLATASQFFKAKLSSRWTAPDKTDDKIRKRVDVVVDSEEEVEAAGTVLRCIYGVHVTIASMAMATASLRVANMWGVTATVMATLKTAIGDGLTAAGVVSDAKCASLLCCIAVGVATDCTIEELAKVLTMVGDLVEESVMIEYLREKINSVDDSLKLLKAISNISLVHRSAALFLYRKAFSNTAKIAHDLRISMQLLTTLPTELFKKLLSKISYFSEDDFVYIVLRYIAAGKVTSLSEKMSLFQDLLPCIRLDCISTHFTVLLSNVVMTLFWTADAALKSKLLMSILNPAPTQNRLSKKLNDKAWADGDKIAEKVFESKSWWFRKGLMVYFAPMLEPTSYSDTDTSVDTKFLRDCFGLTCDVCMQHVDSPSRTHKFSSLMKKTGGYLANSLYITSTVDTTLLVARNTENAIVVD